MEKRRAGAGEPWGLPAGRGPGDLARRALQESGFGRRSAHRRVLADRGGRQDAVLVIGRPLRMLVPMDQDLGQLAGAVRFVAVPVMVEHVRSRPDDLRRHHGDEEQEGGGESLPYTHAGILAQPQREVKRRKGVTVVILVG